MMFIEALKQFLKQTPFFQQAIEKYRLKKIPIADIRCQVKPFSEVQGFSGKTIDHFPPCTFFQLYLNDKNEAYQAYNDWLYDCLVHLEAWKINRADGGWKNGTLVQLIYHVHQNNGIKLRRFENAEKKLIKQAIQEKVEYYFNLFNSIRHNGYVRNTRPPVICYHKSGLHYLTGGHHRVSALYALGQENVHVQIMKNYIP